MFLKLRGGDTKTKYIDWIKDRIIKYKFKENIDFIGFSLKNEKPYYEDEYIAIVKDISKNEYWQIYFKPKAVEGITKWFNENKENIYYEIQYIRNTKNGKKGEIKERRYKIENICYKIISKNTQKRKFIK